MIFRPQRKYFKGANRFRVEAVVGFLFFLIILAASPVLVMMLSAKPGRGSKGFDSIDNLFGERGVFVYLDEHGYEFAGFCVLGALVLTGLCLLYQSFQRRLYTVSFDTKSGMATVELVKPYQKESIIVVLPIEKLDYQIGKEEIGQIAGVMKYKPKIDIVIDGKRYTIASGRSPWERTDELTIQSFAAFFNALPK